MQYSSEKRPRDSVWSSRRIALRWGGVLAAGILICLSVLSEASWGSGERLRRINRRPDPVVAGGKMAAKRRTRALLELMRSRLFPKVDYRGEEETERWMNGMHLVSHQRIAGNTRGFVRRDYLEPAIFRNDVMIVRPLQYRYYHARENVQDFAHWPMEQFSTDRSLLEWFQRGLVTAVGREDEKLLNREAVSIELTKKFGDTRTFRYWIDRETGITLKQEIRNGEYLISRTTLTSLAIGEDVNVRLEEFSPAFPGARVKPYFPGEPHFRSLNEARAILPFTPVEPASLPPGFTLTGVWVTGLNRPNQPLRAVVMLRYSDASNLTQFSLTQQIADKKQLQPAPNRKNFFRRGVQPWLITGPHQALNVVYIGHLPPDQVRAIRDSLR